jgi:hypothetical protein
MTPKLVENRIVGTNGFDVTPLTKDLQSLQALSGEVETESRGAASRSPRHPSAEPDLRIALEPSPDHPDALAQQRRALELSAGG